MLLLVAGCFGDITGWDGDSAGTRPGQYNPTELGTREACFEEKSSPDLRESCTVSQDCRSPLVCVVGQCVAARDEQVTCNPLDSVDCPDPGQVCAAGICTTMPNSCDTSQDCPTDFICDSGQCIHSRGDSFQCTDPFGDGPDLTGNWDMVSTLNLQDGLPEAVASIVSFADKINDLINFGHLGDSDRGLFEDILLVFAADFIKDFLPEDIGDFINVVGQFGDLLSEVTIQAKLNVRESDCKGTYRAKQQFESIVVSLRNGGRDIIDDEIPFVGEDFQPKSDDNESLGDAIAVDREFSLRYHCGQLYFDRQDIGVALGGIAKKILDFAVKTYFKDQQNSSEIPDPILHAPTTIQGLATKLMNCEAVGNKFRNYLQVNGHCPLTDGVSFLAEAVGVDPEDTEFAERALCAKEQNEWGEKAADLCESFSEALVDAVLGEIDDKISEAASVSLQGVATTVRDSRIENGQWNGSTKNSNFEGSFRMEKTGRTTR